MNDDNSCSDFHFNNYLFSFDKTRIDVNIVHEYLSTESYWAQNISKEIVEKSIENSICLGIYDIYNNLIGFGRVITDKATFGYLADVFILIEHRGKGLSKQMVASFCRLADYYGLRRFMLATFDAHGLYNQFGFEGITNPERLMGRKGQAY